MYYLEKLNLFHLIIPVISAIDVKMDCPVLDKTLCLKMLGGFLNCGNCKNCFEENWTHDSFREVFFEVVLYGYKSTFWLCIEYSFHD